MQTPALMQRAKAMSPGGADFKAPDMTAVIPPEMKDTVDRITAAGMKVMFSPDMREELMNELQRDVPMPQKLAEGVVGLVLTLDKQSQGGLPVQAIFPAEMQLLAEAAGVAKAAGQNVSQQDFNDAAILMAILTARKLGAKDDQIMGEAQKWVGGAEGEQGGEMEPGEGQMHEQGEAPMMEQQEAQAEAQGLPEPDEEQMRGA